LWLTPAYLDSFYLKTSVIVLHERLGPLDTTFHYFGAVDLHNRRRRGNGKYSGGGGGGTYHPEEKEGFRKCNCSLPALLEEKEERI